MTFFILPTGVSPEDRVRESSLMKSPRSPKLPRVFSRLIHNARANLSSFTNNEADRDFIVALLTEGDRSYSRFEFLVEVNQVSHLMTENELYLAVAISAELPTERESVSINGVTQ